MASACVTSPDSNKSTRKQQIDQTATNSPELQAFVPASPQEEAHQEAVAPAELHVKHTLAHLMRHSSPKKLQSALHCSLSKQSVPPAASLQDAQASR